jgi:hypothetical protein
MYTVFANPSYVPGKIASSHREKKVTAIEWLNKEAQSRNPKTHN